MINVAMDEFLTSVEKQALLTARMNVSDEADAWDVLQEAMLAMLHYYSKKPVEQWRPLFFKVLYNKINDHHRKQNRWRGWLTTFNGKQQSETDPHALIDSVEDQRIDAEQLAYYGGVNQHIVKAVQQLPQQQRQVFMLRAWQELSVNQSADVLQISPGSVKTHYSRAIESLQQQLTDLI